MKPLQQWNRIVVLIVVAILACTPTNHAFERQLCETNLYGVVLFAAYLAELRAQTPRDEVEIAAVENIVATVSAATAGCYARLESCNIDFDPICRD